MEKNELAKLKEKFMNSCGSGKTWDWLAPLLKRKLKAERLKTMRVMEALIDIPDSVLNIGTRKGIDRFIVSKEFDDYAKQLVSKS